MSSHISGTTKSLAASVLTWLSTSYGSQGISPGYPAYVADETQWIAAQQASGLYSNEIAPVFAKAATEVWQGWSPVPWSTDSVFGSTVVTGLNSGSTMSSQLAGFASQLADFAQSDGYTVVTSP